MEGSIREVVYTGVEVTRDPSTSKEATVTMKMHGNTIFITGGGSGIGRGLAEAFHKLGNRVIGGGRREAVLIDTCAANPGMTHVVLDVADAQSIRTSAHTVISKFPELNCVINNAGLQRSHD